MSEKEISHMIRFLEAELHRYEYHEDQSFDLHKKAVKKSLANFKKLKLVTFKKSS